MPECERKKEQPVQAASVRELWVESERLAKLRPRPFEVAFPEQRHQCERVMAFRRVWGESGGAPRRLEGCGHGFVGSSRSHVAECGVRLGDSGPRLCVVRIEGHGSLEAFERLPQPRTTSIEHRSALDVVLVRLDVRGAHFHESRRLVPNEGNLQSIDNRPRYLILDIE